MTTELQHDKGFSISPKLLTLFTLVFFVVYIPGLLVDVMDVDAAQYATMSIEMKDSGNWLELHCRHNDYLDKPPLLFWLSSFSMLLMGVSNFAYKFPSFLFGILAVWSTIRLTQLVYDRVTSALAGLMVASCLGFFIMMNDVRTDTLLMGSFAFSLWQIMLYAKTKSWRALVLGFMGVGLAMLSKGPLGIVMPVMALSCEFAYKRQWVNFFRWQWLVGLAIVALVIAPMCIGLYQQFDLHPERTVNGQTGVSGLEFYFWTQSFGRITGDSEWGTKFDNGATNLFFTHTFLWAFFPWSILTVIGLFKNIIVLFRSRLKPGYMNEAFATGGFILIFLALSLSKYKLPHYIYVTFPLAAIIAARFLVADVINAGRKQLAVSVAGLYILSSVMLMVISFLIVTVIFPGAPLITWLIAVLMFVAMIAFLFLRKSLTERLMLPLLAALIGCYFVGFSWFYPELLKYQSSNNAGRTIASLDLDEQEFYLSSNTFEHSLDFYSRKTAYYIGLDSAGIAAGLQKHDTIFIYTDEEGYAKMINSKCNFSTYEEYDHFGVQFLTPEFLNPATRASRLHKRYLLKVYGR